MVQATRVFARKTVQTSRGARQKIDASHTGGTPKKKQTSRGHAKKERKIMASVHITIIAVGKLKERFWKDAIAEYGKRLGAFCKLEVREVADRDEASCGGQQKALEKEGQDIIKQLEKCGVSKAGVKNVCCIALAIEGKKRSSEDFAEHLSTLMTSGISHFVFIIGASCGIDTSVYEYADEALSFGDITLPHNLARVVLFEQLYRAFKIINGQPYHK